MLLVFAMGALQSPASFRLTTADVNGDGRPDVWQYFDQRGQLVRVIRDTNYDGRSDVEESYVDGRLARRESDRNFDDRVDLREDFNSSTGEHTRSVVDADFDGTADLVVLFADGRPVYSRWAERPSAYAQVPITAVASVRRHAGDGLRSLDDPFDSSGRFQAREDRPERLAVGGTLSTTGATWPARSVAPYTRSESVLPLRPFFARASLSPATLRGPPAFRALI
jgi:hypothetical protein